MGTINEEPKHGHIFLQKDISGELDRVLATSQHSSMDTFLEHLFDLYTKASKTTQSVRVRDDVAQRFTALQCETRFQTSNDLMKHLLNLHIEYLKKANAETPKPTPPERHAPKKSRKSKPKRNFKLTEEVDSDEGSGSHVTGGSSSDPWREMSVSSVEGSDDNVLKDPTEVDLSRVKQETVDGDEDSKSQKDQDRETKPLCLSLHKPPSARDVRANIDRIAKQALANQTGIENHVKMTRQFNSPNWRSRSEPIGRKGTAVSSKHEPMALQSSPLTGQQEYTTVKMESDSYDEGDRSYGESFMNDEDRSGYNYVLDLASSPVPDGSQSSSLPSSPMNGTAKYPKSISYTISSDEEEAQDLSLSSSALEAQKPHNHSATKSMLQNTGIKDQDNLIKYDSNANALPYGQFPNGPFLSPTQIAIPQNLLFHDPSSVPNIASQPQLLTIAQTGSNSSGNGNPPPLFVAGMPPLLVRGPPPLTSPVMIRPNLTPPNGKFASSPQQMMVPVSTVLSQMQVNNQTPQFDKSSPDGGQSDEGGSPQRRKRKRVEDTTVFRDPQEANLPFNGPNKYRFYCDVCDTGFTRKYTYNRHKCKGKVEKHYCQLCDKAYLSKYKLKDHILVKHEGQTVSCPECGKRFSSRSSMEMHKKQQHEGMFSIFCKICGKGFNHTGHYYGHMNKHTNTKPFWCQQCGKRFYGSSYLHNHKQVCRGNSELNFSCSICDRKFKCELYLKKHMKIHDSTPLITNPNVAKATDEDLAKAGVQVVNQSALNGAIFADVDQPVFPNGPDMSDSNSNSNSGALQIDEAAKMDMDASQNDPLPGGNLQARPVVA